VAHRHAGADQAQVVDVVVRRIEDACASGLGREATDDVIEVGELEPGRDAELDLPLERSPHRSG
jgi:hypothetical protein